MRFWSFKNVSDEEVELRIDGDIVDDDLAWIYEWFDEVHTSPNAFREALKEHAGKNITVWIDTDGGSVWAAAGIYDALKSHNGRINVKVTKAISAGSVIAMAGDDVMVSPVGGFMIHNPWVGWLSGEARDLRHTADVLDTLKESIMNAYELKTGLSRDELSRLMDNETYMSAQKAVELGFADGILYADEQKKADDPPKAMAFAFSRMAIQNKMTASMERFFDVAEQMHREKAKPALALQLELLKLKGDVIVEDDDDQAGVC